MDEQYTKSVIYSAPVNFTKKVSLVASHGTYSWVSLKPVVMAWL